MTQQILLSKHIRIAENRRVRLVTGDDGIFAVVGDQLTKLDRESCEIVWRAPVVKDSGLAFVHGSVLLSGRAGNFSGIDVADGRRVWGPVSLGNCLRWNDGVIGIKPLAVVDPTDGTLVRTLSTSEDLLGDASICGDVLVGKSIVSRTGDPVTAYHLGHNRVLWKRDIAAEATVRAGSDESTGLMAASPRTLLLGRKDYLFGCSAEDGSIRWERKITLPYLFPCVSGHRVYVLSVDYNEPAHLVCLDIETGRVIYDVAQPLIHPLDRTHRGVVHDGQIAFGTEKGRLVVFRLEDGAALWWSEYDDTLFPPSFVDSRVLVPTIDGNLLVFEPPA